MASQNTASLKKVADMMRDLDFCMLTTHADDGQLRSRPMSNNGEVEFDGDVWFFSGADTRKVADIETEARVELNYADTQTFRFVSMSGTATIVRDVDKKRELWIDDLARWFKDGPESEDVVLIKVTPSVVAYWQGEDEGEIALQ
ncbi:MAG: pyridoxamine 5'-phosphate oxidase family protein [Gemmatimonadaceae bacterium]|nr:pyridoxamine 5'-phosphate oxidase family protein [Gemmatimonadaceae bacterium]